VFIKKLGAGDGEMDKIEAIKAILGENPESGQAWCLLGIEYRNQEKVSEALEAFSQALKFGSEELKQQIYLELARLASGAQVGSSGSGAAAKETAEAVAKEQAELTDRPIRGAVEEPSRKNGDSSRLVPLQVVDGGKNCQVVSLETKAKPVVTFNDVGGLESLKENIRMKIIKPFTNPGLFARFRKKSGGGMLLFGPPGCGKTFIAKATAGECRARFISVHITDILDPYLGMSEQNIKNIFDTARSQTPSIMFFDEIDAIGFHRAKAASQHMRPVVDQLLAEMEGIDTSTDKLLVIGATNMPWDVDPAFKRPGRFDKLIFVPPPDEVAREIIFNLKLAGKPVGDVDLRLLAKKTELYSGADIENVVELATENVLTEILEKGSERLILMLDLIEAIESTKPSTIEWLRTIKNYVKYANQSGQYDEIEQFLSRHKKKI
jgi:SpoVK/Ycf46/Vps4 family AAA+-type ATPase